MKKVIQAPNGEFAIKEYDSKGGSKSVSVERYSSELEATIAMGEKKPAASKEAPVEEKEAVKETKEKLEK